MMWDKLKHNLKYLAAISIIVTLNLTAWWMFFPKSDNDVDSLEMFVADGDEIEEKINIKDNWLKVSPELDITDDYDTEESIHVGTKEEISDENSVTSDFNDYLIDLYNKVAEQNDQIESLKKEIALNESRREINSAPQNIDNISLLLIELYRIKNLAYLGHEFGSKIQNIYPLAGNISQLKENLIQLKSINILPDITSIQIQLKNLEREVIKRYQAEQKTTISGTIKIALADLVKIKQVKNLDDDSIMHQFMQLEEAFKTEDYKTAYILAQTLELSSNNLNILQKSLQSLNDFSLIFDNSLAVIFNIRS